MSSFYKNYLPASELEDSTSVKVSDLLCLIEKSDYYHQLTKLFDIESIKDEIIQLPGLKVVINSCIRMNSSLAKLDINSHPAKIRPFQIDGSKELLLQFYENTDYQNLQFSAKTAYNVKSEFYQGFYGIDKFADYCTNKGLFDIISKNVAQINETLKDNEEHNKRFRFLRDVDNNYFVRAITSTTVYRDYNILFSVFVTAMQLHMLSREYDHSYTIIECDLTESSITLLVKKVDPMIIDNIGEVNFTIQMTNDEIKRSAFRLDMVYSVSLDDDIGQYTYFNPPKSNLVSMGHGKKLTTVLENIETLGTQINRFMAEMSADLSELFNINDPRRMQFKIIERIKNKSIFNKYKEPMLRELNREVNRLSETVSESVSVIC